MMMMMVMMMMMMMMMMMLMMMITDVTMAAAGRDKQKQRKHQKPSSNTAHNPLYVCDWPHARTFRFWKDAARLGDEGRNHREAHALLIDLLILVLSKRRELP